MSVISNDLILDENGDLKIIGGDFVIGDSNMQIFYDLLNYNLGDLKKFLQLFVN